jgi:dihydrofolate reductase
MRRLVVFNHVTLDGYIASAQGDMSWAHPEKPDAEWDAFVAGNASGGETLLFGRVTYQLMASFWPTPLARERDPVVAERMNGLEKVVFSRTLPEATWRNTTLLRADVAGEVRKLKQRAGRHIAVMGSGSLVAQLAAEDLVDELQVVVNPIALGAGKTMFEGIGRKLAFRHVSTRSFANGKVVLAYEPQPR